jgi:hypothetical protein
VWKHGANMMIPWWERQKIDGMREVKSIAALLADITAVATILYCFDNYVKGLMVFGVHHLLLVIIAVASAIVLIWDKI